MRASTHPGDKTAGAVRAPDARPHQQVGASNDKQGSDRAGDGEGAVPDRVALFGEG